MIGQQIEMPFTRRTDPETSFEAAASIHSLTRKQEAVFEVFRCYKRMHDAELLIRYPPEFPKQSPSGLRTRRSELVRAGRLEHTGDYAENAQGRRCRIWGLTDA